jgi:hypothetical protein
VHIMTRSDVFDINSREFTGAADPVQVNWKSKKNGAESNGLL